MTLDEALSVMERAGLRGKISRLDVATAQALADAYAEVDVVKAENAALRAALTKIATLDGWVEWLQERRVAGDDLDDIDWCVHVAREALGDRRD